MKITVFGSATPRPDTLDYQEAFRLGRMIGEAGYTVLTGGYMGTMEAISRGVAENGGHVIGVTCEEIENWRQAKANRWVQEEWHMPTLQERLQKLVENCNVAIALPGGVGTLTEILLLWNQLVIHAMTPRPLILIGLGWQKLFQAFFDLQGKYVNNEGRKFLIFVDDIQQAFNLVKEMETNT